MNSSIVEDFVITLVVLLSKRNELMTQVAELWRVMVESGSFCFFLNHDYTPVN